MSKNTIIKTISGNNFPEFRLSTSNAKFVFRSRKDGYRIKMDESTIDASSNDCNMSIKINYDLGLLTRFLKPIVDPFMGIAKKLALKLLDRVSIEFLQESSDTKLEMTRRENTLVVSAGATKETFKISGREILNMVETIKSKDFRDRIEAGDFSWLHLDYNVSREGVSITSPSGDIMLNGIELKDGRMLYIESAFVDGKFYSPMVMDIYHPYNAPKWMHKLGEDVLEVLMDFYCK